MRMKWNFFLCESNLTDPVLNELTYLDNTLCGLMICRGRKSSLVGYICQLVASAGSILTCFSPALARPVLLG